MKPSLEELRLATLECVTDKLALMLKDHGKRKFFEKCPIKHISEMVKLCHQAKSLEIGVK